MSAIEQNRGAGTAEHAYLLPPPRRLQHGELPPVIEPALHGVPAFDGPAPDHFEPFASEALAPAVSAELSERIRAAVLEHGAVRDHLAGVRFEWIGVSALDEKHEQDGGGALLAILYSYRDDRAIEVRLDRNGETIHDVSVLPYQPPPTEEEIQRAVELAAADSRLAERLSKDEHLVGTAILVSPSDQRSPSFGHRTFDVRFGYPSERLPRFMAMVDLSREAVVSVGSCCARDLGGELRQEGVRP
jgi:hypothetical protein